MTTVCRASAAAPCARFPTIPSRASCSRTSRRSCGMGQLLREVVAEMCRPVPRRRCHPRAGHRGARLHPGRGSGHRARRRIRARPEAGQAALGAGHRSLRSGVRQRLARGPSGRLDQGSRVLVVDDVLATGGTARAAGQLARGLGAELVGWSFLLEIGALRGRERLQGAPATSVARVARADSRLARGCPGLVQGCHFPLLRVDPMRPSEARRLRKYLRSLQSEALSQRSYTSPRSSDG